MYVPVPAPSVVFEFVTVGFWFVLQQIPLTEISAPPSFIISPPPDADVDLTFAISKVFT